MRVNIFCMTRAALGFALVLCIAHCAGSEQEWFTEEALAQPLPVGKYMVHLHFEQYSTRHRHHTQFPRPVAKLAHQARFDSVEVALTHGRWHTRLWGQSPVPTHPVGVEARLVLPADVPDDEARYTWSHLVHSLSGALCASLNLMASPDTWAEHKLSHLQSLAGHDPAVQPRVLYSSMAREPVCTENLTPWLKLLPCRDQAGLAGLLRDRPTIYSAEYFSLTTQISVRRTPGLPPTNLTVRLTQTVTMVFRLPALGSTGSTRSTARGTNGPPGALTLRRLMNAPPVRQCPVASISRVYVNNIDDVCTHHADDGSCDDGRSTVGRETQSDVGVVSAGGDVTKVVTPVLNLVAPCPGLEAVQAGSTGGTDRPKAVVMEAPGGSEGYARGDDGGDGGAGCSSGSAASTEGRPAQPAKRGTTRMSVLLYDMTNVSAVPAVPAVAMAGGASGVAAGEVPLPLWDAYDDESSVPVASTLPTSQGRKVSATGGGGQEPSSSSSSGSSSVSRPARQVVLPLLSVERYIVGSGTLRGEMVLLLHRNERVAAIGAAAAQARRHAAAKGSSNSSCGHGGGEGVCPSDSASAAAAPTHSSAGAPPPPRLVCVYQAVPWYIRVWVHTLQLSFDGQDVPLRQYMLSHHIRPARDRASMLSLDLCLHLPSHVRTASLAVHFSKAFLGVFEFPADANRGFDVPPALITYIDPGAARPACWVVPKPPTDPSVSRPVSHTGVSAGGVREAGAADDDGVREGWAVGRRVPEGGGEDACVLAMEEEEEVGRTCVTSGPLLQRLAHPTEHLLYGDGVLVTLASPDFSMPYNVICLTSTVLAVYLGLTTNVLIKRRKSGSPKALSKRLKLAATVLLTLVTVGLAVYLDEGLQESILGVVRS